MNQLALVIEKIYGAIKKVFSFLNAIMVTVLVGVVVLDIVGTLLKCPITITVELTGLMFAWITALAGVLIVMDDENIALTFIKDKFHGVTRLIVDLIIDGLSLAFSILMFKSSIEINMEMATQRMAQFGFSKCVLYSSMSVMFGLISIVLILQIILRFVKKEKAA